MDLKVVGAGLGRTGTHTLHVVLQQLLGAPCYHMVEVFNHPEHVPTWQDAYDGKSVDFAPVLDGYAAAVDWPSAWFWKELSEANPDALILLTTRDSADTWWKSANNTIFQMAPTVPDDAWRNMVMKMLEVFDPNWSDEEAAKAAYERHNAAVRAEAPKDRFLDYQVSQGWEPLCEALGVPVPDEPFPVTNTSAEWAARADASGTGATP